MAKAKIEKPKYDGKNVRIKTPSHDLVSAFCKEKGFVLGTFFELAALEKMERESAKNL